MCTCVNAGVFRTASALDSSIRGQCYCQFKKTTNLRKITLLTVTDLHCFYLVKTFGKPSMPGETAVYASAAPESKGIGDKAC